MNGVRLLALILATLALRPCSAQGLASSSVSVHVETATHSEFTGTLEQIGQSHARIFCDFGVLIIDPEKIREIHLTRPVENPDPTVLKGLAVGEDRTVFAGEVVTTGGKTIAGEIGFPNWKVETEMGNIMLAPSKVRTITFLKPGVVPVLRGPSGRPQVLNSQGVPMLEPGEARPRPGGAGSSTVPPDLEASPPSPIPESLTNPRP